MVSDTPTTDPSAVAQRSRGRGLLGFVLGVFGSFAFFSVRGTIYLGVTAAVLVVLILFVWGASTRRLMIGFAAGWLTPLALGLGLMLWWAGALGDLFLSGDFDAAAWRAKHEASFSDRTRLRMVEDLRQSKRLDGRTRAEVLELLGPPSSHHGDELTWRLGPDRGIGIDSSLLTVRFGSDGRVARHWVWED